MYIQAPDITIDATVGQVIVQSTSTPTSTPSQTPSGSTPTPSSTQKPSATPEPIATLPSNKKYKQNELIIYGYGPSNSEIILKGFGVSEKTISDNKGLFVFSGIYSYTYTYPELCLQAFDDKKRSTQPSCIPALPNDSLIPLEVGPILLSPTISITKNNIKEGGESILSGKTIPNSNVNVFMAKKDKFELSSFLINESLAYNLPSLSIKSNDKGEYELNLPTNQSAEYNIFTSSKYGEDLTNKSTTIKFVVFTKLKTLLQRIYGLIMENKMLAVIFTEILIFVILFLNALKSTKRVKRGHLESDYLDFIK